MTEGELAIRALGKLIFMWSPVILGTICGLAYIGYSEKLERENRQAIKRAERNEREVA